MLIEDFYEKTMPIPESGCWIWMGQVKESGYGRLTLNGKIWRAHRFSWFLNFGEIPLGMQVCHKCDVRSCVNPDHLFLGTNSDNQRDSVAKGRNQDTSCENSHVAILNNEQVLKIRKELKDGARSCDLASKYGVSRPTISCIKSGRKWAKLM